MKRREFRSDTLTVPSQKMRDAMRDAEVGDDVYDEDPTVNRLQEEAAKKMGKPAALFVPSGTCGNQCALGAHISSGDEVIVAEPAHTLQHETGAAAGLWGGQIRAAIPKDTTYLTVADIAPRLRTRENVHEPDTGLIVLENALSDGSVMPLEEMENVRALAVETNVKVHLDGARIFNAATALKVEAREIAAKADSVMFCLSKGLGAPVGSILAGNAEFIARAKKKRKMLGGGMRQVGVLAAPALIALQEGPEKLATDHANAKRLAEGILKIPGFKLDLATIQTNIIFFSIESGADTEQAFVDHMRNEGFNMNDPMHGGIRVVTSYEVEESDVQAFLEAARKFVSLS